MCGLGFVGLVILLIYVLIVSTLLCYWAWRLSVKMGKWLWKKRGDLSSL